MARPKSVDRHNSILSAATSVIAAQGLGAPTAAIAKEAGVSNGSLFGYFDSKTTLLNELYVELKSEMGAAAVDGLPATGDSRSQLQHMWFQWLAWATSYPAKRRALSQLQVSDDITADSHRVVSAAYSGIAALLERCRENGAMRQAPLSLVVTLTNAIAEATIDAMIADPHHADETRTIAFDAMWRMLS